MSTPSEQPNWKLPLFLSALLAGGGSLVYWYHYSKRPAQEKAETQQKKPLALPSDETQISMIKVKSAKGLIELKCEDLAAKNCKSSTVGNWKVSHPVELKGDGANVKEFLTSAASVVSTDMIDLKEETPEKRKALLQEYGLSDDQRAQLNTQFVELITEDGKRITAWFGTEHPLGDKFFVARSVDGQVQDQSIYLISSYYRNNLTRELTYFRDKTLFEFSRGEVDRFEAKTQHGNLVGKKVEGLWTVNGMEADHDMVDTLLAAIGKTSAKEFPEASATTGAKKLVRYDFSIKDKNLWIELFEKTQGGTKQASGTKQFFAKVSTRPEMVEVDSLLESQINKKAADLRKRSIMGDAEKVTATLAAIEPSDSNTPWEFELKNGAWIAKNSQLKLDINKLKELLDGLTQVRVQEFTAKIPSGKNPSVLVQLGDDKNAAKFKFRFWLAKDKTYAQNLLQKGGAVVLMNDVLKNALPFSPDSWKMKE